MLVDPRVGSGDLLKPLQLFGVPAELAPTNMEAGDCAFIGRGVNDEQVFVGVELKRTSDVVSCLYSGRYTAEQVPKLQRLYGHQVWLITEGLWRAGKGGVLEEFHWSTSEWRPVMIGMRGIIYRDLETWLLSQTLKGGFHYKHCNTKHDTIRFLSVLYHWWTDKSLEEHRSHQAIYIAPPHRVPMIEASPFAKMASCLPKIGWEKAHRLEDLGFTFQLLTPTGSIATAKDLSIVPGIGPLMAGQILDTLAG